MDQILSLYQSVKHNLSGNIIVDIVKRTVSQPQLYSFGEIRDALNNNLEDHKQSLSLDGETEALQWLEILDIFTYGTWSDYKSAVKQNKNGSFPSLDDIQKKKLKQLSLATLAANSQRLEYRTIADLLDIDSQDLETFLVDSMYDGLIVGKLDTKRQALEVSTVFGRDVSAERLQEIENNLDEWVTRTESILQDTGLYIHQYRADSESRKKEIEEYNAAVDRVNSELAKKQKKIVPEPEA